MKLENLLFGLLCAIALASGAIAQEFDIKQGDSVVGAFNFGQGDHVVIFLHGKGGDRTYMKKYSDEIVKAGFRIISINWSGEEGAGHNELSAAVKFARAQGAKKISLAGLSRGANLVANYAKAQPDGEFDTLVLFSCSDDKGIPLTKTKKLFVFNKLDSIVSQWAPMGADKSAEPKQVIALGGNGHTISGLVSQKADLMQDVVTTLKH
jgi:dienelactone hydrolase